MWRLGLVKAAIWEYGFFPRFPWSGPQASTSTARRAQLARYLSIYSITERGSLMQDFMKPTKRFVEND